MTPPSTRAGEIEGVFGDDGLVGGGRLGEIYLSLEAPVPVNRGGTGGATPAAARHNILNALGNAVGDIYYRNSATSVTRLPIGTQGFVLTAGTTGMPIWAPGGGGPGGGAPWENAFTADVEGNGFDILGLSDLQVSTINGLPVSELGGGSQTPFLQDVLADGWSLYQLNELACHKMLLCPPVGNETCGFYQDAHNVVQLTKPLNVTGAITVNGQPIGGGGGGSPQTPWASNIDGGGYSLTNAGWARFGSGQPIETMVQILSAGVNPATDNAMMILQGGGYYTGAMIQFQGGQGSGSIHYSDWDYELNTGNQGLFISAGHGSLVPLPRLKIFTRTGDMSRQADFNGTLSVDTLNGKSVGITEEHWAGVSLKAYPGQFTIACSDDPPAFNIYNDTTATPMLGISQIGNVRIGPGWSDAAYRLDVAGEVNATGYNVGGVPFVGSSGSRAASGQGLTLLNIEEIAFTDFAGAGGPGMTIDGWVNVTEGYYVNGQPFTGGDGDGFVAVWPADVNASGHNLAGVYKISAYSVENVHELWIDANPDTRVGTKIDKSGIHWRDVASHPDIWAFERHSGDGDIYLYYTTPPVAGPPQSRVCMVAHSSGLIEFPSGFLTEHIGMHDSSGQSADIGPGWLSLNYSSNDRINLGPDYLVMTLHEATADRVYLGIWPEPDGTVIIRSGYGYNDHDTTIDPAGTLHVHDNLVVRGDSTGDDVSISFMKYDRGFKLDYNNYLGELAMYDPDGFSPLRMRNGNVAIGYDSYGYSSRLSVNGNVNVLGAMGINCQSPVSELELRAAQYGSSFAGATLRFGSGIGTGDIKIGGIDFVSQSTIFASIQAYTGNSSYIGRIIFYTGGTERIRLDESGDVRITGRLFINGVQVTP